MALASAGTWQVDDLEVLDLDPVVDVSVGPDGRLAVLHPHALAWVDPASGKVTSRPGGGRSVAWVQATEGAVVVRCGRDGLHQVREDGTVTRMDGRACDAVAPSGRTGVVAARQGFARQVGLDGDVSDLDLRLVADAFLVRAGDDVVIGARGANHMVRVGADGHAVVAVGGRLDALANAEELLWAARGPTPRVHLGAHHTDLPERVQGIAAADLDGDGVTDVLAWSDDAWLLPHALDVPVPREAAGADLDQDGCTDLVLWVDDQILLAWGHCPTPTEQPAPPTPYVPSDAPFPEAVDLVDRGARGWPPAVWVEGPRIDVADLPAAPDHVDLADGGPWEVVPVFAGSEVAFTVSIDGRRWLGRAEGGPPSLAVLQRRVVVVQPTDDDIGRWPVSLQRPGGPWSGLLLDVWPRPRPGDPLPEAFGPPGRATSPPVEPPAPTETTAKPWTVTRCGLGTGLASGAVPRGPRDDGVGLRHSWSVAVGATCDLGQGPVTSWVGLDAAPWFRYYRAPFTRGHVAAASAGIGLGDPRLRVGPWGSLGLGTAALGARVSAWPSNGPWGADLRAGWLAPTDGWQAMALLMRRL